MDEAVLRVLARAVLDAGLLPRPLPPARRSRRGLQALCMLCGTPIAGVTVEIDVGAAPRPAVRRFHQPCFDVLCDEAQRLASR